MPEEFDPESEAEALSDAVFEEGLNLPPRRRPRVPPAGPPRLVPIPGPGVPSPDEPAAEERPVTPSPDSPFRDYVRELQQEFEEQEEEGKL
jgi:hypothetical protein